MTPFVTMPIGSLVAVVVGPPIGAFMTALGNVIMWARAAANHHGNCYLSGRWGGTHTADFQRSAVYYAEPLWDSSWSGDCGLLLPDGRFRGSEL